MHEQGCRVHLIDNWSSDGTIGAAKADSVERWPIDGPTQIHDREGMLKRIEEVALLHPRRWIIVHDADEIRRAEAGRLAQALFAVERAGYNAASFHAITFAPVDNGWDALRDDPEVYFRWRYMTHVDTRGRHVKAWVQGEERVDIHSTGGHVARFEGAKAAVGGFILKHYPIRSQAHGERKVLRERLARYAVKELARGWHVQYDGYQEEKPNFIQPKEGLIEEARMPVPPRRNVAIVTLTRFPDLFYRLAASVEAHEPARRKIVVTSGGAEVEAPGWEVVRGIEPFAFARNLNLGIQSAGNDDVLAVNDDVELTEPLIHRLQDAMAAGHTAVITPQVIGDGINNALAHASRPLGTAFVKSPHYVPFVCVLLNREALLDVGLLEVFEGYGGDDQEFCCRVVKHGWDLAVCGVRVKHGFREHRFSSSFMRVMTAEERIKSMRAMQERAARMAGKRL